MAEKSVLKSSNKENWFLYKIRDRAYDPSYKLEVQEKNGVETLFLTDQDTAWSEGVNSSGIMVVSAALDNHSDLDDNGSGSSGSSVSFVPRSNDIPEKKSGFVIQMYGMIFNQSRVTMNQETYYYWYPIIVESVRNALLLRANLTKLAHTCIMPLSCISTCQKTSI